MRKNRPVDIWRRIDMSGGRNACWPWLGSTDDKGYPRVSYEGNQTALVHRVIFFFVHGYWPNVCRHKCDNPICCNPRHLEAGTQADNIADRVKRGRSGRRPGATNHNAKLTMTQARIIRRSPLSYSQLAAAYSVSKKAVRNIKLGFSYKEEV